MMPHWRDPISRGVWDHPAATPPRPQPLGTNNLDTRVARLEMHQEWSTFNAARVERESRERASDIVDQSDEDRAKIEDLNRRVQSLERDRHVRRVMWQQARILGTSFWGFARYLVGLILLIAVLTGKADVESLREIKETIGLFSGTSSPR